MMQASAYGRLGRDPETRIAASGKEWTAATLAVDVTGHNDDTDRTLWLRVVAFGKAGEALARHGKGDLVAVMGRVTVSHWTDREGNERESFNMVAEQVVSARTVRPGGRRVQGATQRRQHEDLNDQVPF